MEIWIFFNVYNNRTLGKECCQIKDTGELLSIAGFSRNFMVWQGAGRVGWNVHLIQMKAWVTNNGWMLLLIYSSLLISNSTDR
jgi:hypothetical protein